MIDPLTLLTQAHHQGRVPFGQHMPELAQDAAQGIGLHDAQLQQLRAQAVQRQHRLLGFGLDRHRSQSRLLAGDPDRLGIGRISLVALDEGAYRTGWQQRNRSGPARQRARPVVGAAAAGFHPHPAGRALGKPRRHLRTLELGARDLAGPRVDAVQLEDVLSGVHPDRP